MAQIYVELPVGDSAESAVFFAQVFGWSLTGFGPTYAATTTGDGDVGVQADPDERTTAPLPVVMVDDLDVIFGRVAASGATIIRPVFTYSGGRRFHFADPSGNEIGVAQAD